MIEMIRKHKLLIAMSVLIVAILVVFVKQKKIDLFSTSDEKNEEDLVAQKNGNIVLIQSAEDETKRMDLGNGKISESDALEKEDFSDFLGFPKLGINDNKVTAQSLVIVSADKSKAIVKVETGGLNPEGKEVKNSESGYVCDAKQKKCEPSDILNRSYAGLDRKLQENGQMWWSKWDSEKNKLYGYLNLEGVGTVSPVYICDTNKNACAKTEGLDYLNENEKKAVVPEGNFSPSLKKFVMIVQNDVPNEETGKNWELLMFGSNDLSNPLKRYDISVMIDREDSVAYDGVNSVSWSGDEKKLAVGTSRRIFMLDLDSEKISLVYVAPSDEEGDYYWDISSLYLSQDAKFIAFVDEAIPADDEIDIENSGNDEPLAINALKKIDLENSNKVTEMFEAAELGLKL